MDPTLLAIAAVLGLSADSAPEAILQAFRKRMTAADAATLNADAADKLQKLQTDHATLQGQHDQLAADLATVTGERDTLQTAADAAADAAALAPLKKLAADKGVTLAADATVLDVKRTLAAAIVGDKAKTADVVYLDGVLAAPLAESAKAPVVDAATSRRWTPTVADASTDVDAYAADAAAQLNTSTGSK